MDRKLPVLALAGTSTYRYLKEKKITLSKIDPLSVANAVNLILRGRADYFVYHDIGLRYYLKHNFLANKLVFAAKPVRRYNHWMVFSKHVPAHVIAVINATIGKMVASGEIQAILTKYR